MDNDPTNDAIVDLAEAFTALAGKAVPRVVVERALCAQTDPDAFFPEKGLSAHDAKVVCSACPVQVECLDYALTNGERFGVWGGLSERERRELARRAS